jgi:hypothetical protein
MTTTEQEPNIILAGAAKLLAAREALKDAIEELENRSYEIEGRERQSIGRLIATFEQTTDSLSKSLISAKVYGKCEEAAKVWELV